MFINKNEKSRMKLGNWEKGLSIIITDLSNGWSKNKRQIHWKIDKLEGDWLLEIIVEFKTRGWNRKEFCSNTTSTPMEQNSLHNFYELI